MGDTDDMYSILINIMLSSIIDENYIISNLEETTLRLRWGTCFSSQS